MVRWGEEEGALGETGVRRGSVQAHLPPQPVGEVLVDGAEGLGQAQDVLV